MNRHPKLGIQKHGNELLCRLLIKYNTRLLGRKQCYIFFYSRFSSTPLTTALPHHRIFIVTSIYESQIKVIQSLNTHFRKPSVQDLCYRYCIVVLIIVLLEKQICVIFQEGIIELLQVCNIVLKFCCFVFCFCCRHLTSFFFLFLS